MLEIIISNIHFSSLTAIRHALLPPLKVGRRCSAWKATTQQSCTLCNQRPRELLCLRTDVCISLMVQTYTEAVTSRASLHINSTVLKTRPKITYQFSSFSIYLGDRIISSPTLSQHSATLQTTESFSPKV